MDSHGRRKEPLLLGTAFSLAILLSTFAAQARVAAPSSALLATPGFLQEELFDPPSPRISLAFASAGLPFDVSATGTALVIRGELPFPLIPLLVAAALVWVVVNRRRRGQWREQVILETVRAERSRLTVELHDVVAQGLTSVGLYIEGARGMLGPNANEAESLLKTAKSLVGATLVDSKRVLNGFGSSSFEEPSLADALQRVLTTTAGTGHVHHALDVQGAPFPLERSVESQLYRIAQEAVTNAIRHAQARLVSVSLLYANASVALTIVNDGDGLGRFDAGEWEARGNGIRGMRERARQIGASFSIAPTEAGGVRIEVTVAATAGRGSFQIGGSSVDRDGALS